MVFTRTWNSSYEALPADGDAISAGASRIRQVKTDIQERVVIDHSFAGNADDGKHTQVTFVNPLGSDPADVADEGMIYTKNVNSVVELFWKDESGNVAQMSSLGAMLASLKATTLAKTGTYTALTVDRGKLILANGTSGAFTVTLPTVASAADNFVIGVKKIDGTDNAITIDGNGSETIDGATTLVLTNRYDVAWLVCDGTQWHLMVQDHQGIVQIQTNFDLAMTTGSTLISQDDTIPQKTEGNDASIDVTITPKSTTNRLLILALVHGAHGTPGGLFNVALYQDTTSNSLATSVLRMSSAANSVHQNILMHEMVAGTVSATTLKIRAGTNDSGTFTINGHSGGRVYGGVLVTALVVIEYKP